MKPTTIIKIGFIAFAVLALVALGSLGAAKIISERTVPDPQIREEAAQIINSYLWSNPPENPDIEETKRLLLICATIRQDDVDTHEEQMRFLERWQADIERQGPSNAQSIALACTTDPMASDPSPPIVQPIVMTPQP